MTDEVTPEVTPVVEPSWFIDEGIPGVGDRPEWLDNKFKNAAELAKSYRELEKKVGTPPEEYDISKSKFLDADYEPIQDFLKLAKDKRVPKDVVDKLVESLDKYVNEFSTDYAEEAKKLGENSRERLTTLDNWAQANLSESAYLALTGSLKSADAIKAMEEIRSKMMSNNPVVPSGKDADNLNVQTVEDIQKELSTNLSKYKTDPKYQADIRARLEIASKNSNYVDKMGA